jgi:adenylate cyclase class IV
LGQNVELKARDRDPESSRAMCRALGAEAGGVLRQRADSPEQRQSEYRIVAIENADELEAALVAALWEDVRIHLDRVEELGSFIEFEAVVADDALDLVEARNHVENLRRRLEIADDDLITGSYCDLITDAAGA